MSTRPADLDAVLATLVDGVRDVLGERLAGVHLVGSWALGCADEWSDVDVVVVTDGRADETQVAGLTDLHTRLHGLGGWGAHLEVGYAPLSDLRSPMTLGRRWWYVDHGSTVVEESDHDNTAHARWVLRERGVALHGPPARDVVAEVTPEALRAEALGDARARAERLEDDPSAYQDAWFQPHCVLTSCRVLFTATRAEVTGKLAAARWALETLTGPDVRHRPLVERAVADRPHPWERVGRPADPALVAPTRAFVWDVVRLAGTAALEARPPGT
ncbi:hypothetical protein GCM10023340_27160 [Nocardioides marinquilinus]|uniref:DUF4111 domain-containing protein n=1 Tax=Nocardioides marinquilinus TaxID=1210400 RepID=A0ABP9PU73_9ACTN